MKKKSAATQESVEVIGPDGKAMTVQVEVMQPKQKQISVTVRAVKTPVTWPTTVQVWVGDPSFRRKTGDQ